MILDLRLGSGFPLLGWVGQGGRFLPSNLPGSGDLTFYWALRCGGWQRTNTELGPQGAEGDGAAGDSTGRGDFGAGFDAAELFEDARAITLGFAQIAEGGCDHGRRGGSGNRVQETG